MSLPLTHFPERGFISFIDAPVQADPGSLDAQVAILGVPYAMPYRMDQSATHAAPGYLREKSLRFAGALTGHYSFDFDGELLDGQDLRIVDCGDVPGDPYDHRGNVERATEAVGAILSRGAVPIVFGGDDAVPIPVLRAYEEHGPVVVVQIDQHLDFKDEREGVREGYSSPMRRASEMAWVAQIVQVGLRGMGSALTADVVAARAAGNVLVTEHEVRRDGMAAVLERIPAGSSYFITLDADGLDPTICPAVSHPEPGGLTFAETTSLLEGLAAKGRVVGMDMVEVVPDHDLNGLGGHTLGRLVVNLIHAMVRSGQLSR